MEDAAEFAATMGDVAVANWGVHRRAMFYSSLVQARNSRTVRNKLVPPVSVDRHGDDAVQFSHADLMENAVYFTSGVRE